MTNRPVAAVNPAVIPSMNDATGEKGSLLTMRKFDRAGGSVDFWKFLCRRTLTVDIVHVPATRGKYSVNT